MIAAAHRDSDVLDRLREYGTFRGEPVTSRNVQRVLEVFGAHLRAVDDNAPTLTFRSPIEIADALPDAPPAIWHGFLYPGAVTILAGKPKCGKSTLIAALLAALADGADDFLGSTIERTPSVFVTEESDLTAAPKLPLTAQIRVLTRDAAWPKPSWLETINAATVEAVKFGCRLLVVDTFAFWAQLASDKEKDAGAVTAALDVLIEAASAHGLAVLLVHHAKKGGGEDGESLRGSSAIAGAVDVILELERPGEDAPVGQRVLLGLSRFPGTPASLLIERAVDGDWRSLGQSESRSGVQSIALREELVELLQEAPDGLTRDELLAATGRRGWRPINDALKSLEISGQVAPVDGTGFKGAPKVWQFCSAASEQKGTAGTESTIAEVSVSCSAPLGADTGTETGYGDSVPAEQEQEQNPADVDLAERLADKYDEAVE